ncbi:tagatose-6-phosphate kinase, putative [Entamoeba histolytica HM-1:IMSS-B]|uniref:Tagatose-6-phosphate kinase, putative n=5 Tax=Entamoeba histolytica TaxID=5759 RepID=C4LZG3_ENTH1|nr:tagatose-6-phosphate kinase, putative [Entamoeba histolytica HM-1:IMSS]EMD45832.1 tagatose-6-phosphate kinase, putative [Entamoeba histolytica KU27]EMH75229.1 tagatose-6-phosphate kinase, putative [Entamoeba histolytica HM-1:IMSS-B]ENY63299.1 tagatose-6-phosphate kinase, putative [Entamoeba histolytica HM-1:IMSS-A]GAT94253.1 tagatose 6 phosphate kinase putative [Entamoeba histolytica]EAL50521.1 tagatose-6-phosphate kinase, putative [Entamoeba histolytica HM-1:IMSS]|eukprot:XP_655905.1 tagatose-6-phosphate kinase, putative [Entamoeba histolytica HM-1:IMSS]
MTVLVVCLNPVIQKTMIFKKFLKGEVNRAKESFWCASGKGVNVCRVLQQQSIPHILLTQNNGEHSQWFTQLCKKDSIQLVSIPIGGIRFCTTILEDGNATELVEEGIPISQEEVHQLLPSFKQIIQSHSISVVVFTGSTAPGIPSDTFQQMAHIAHLNNCKVIADTRGEPLLSLMKEHPEIIKPNESEFIQTYGSLDKAKEISQLGTTVIITRGSKPTIVYENGIRSEIPVEQINLFVNPIGCGDSFTAGLSASLISSSSLSNAITQGHHCAARNIETITPGSLI